MYYQVLFRFIAAVFIFGLSKLKKDRGTYKVEASIVLQIGVEGEDQVMQVKGAWTQRAGQERGEKGKKEKTTLVGGMLT